MLWSLIIKPRTKYLLEDHVARDVILHISKATLDTNSATGLSRYENISLFMDSSDYGKVILCNLSIKNSQEDLDLDVDPRDVKLVTLYSNNKATIHLTGYTKKV